MLSPNACLPVKTETACISLPYVLPLLGPMFLLCPTLLLCPKLCCYFSVSVGASAHGYHRSRARLAPLTPGFDAILCFDGHVSVILSLAGERPHTSHLQRHVILSATWDSYQHLGHPCISEKWRPWHCWDTTFKLDDVDFGDTQHFSLTIPKNHETQITSWIWWLYLQWL